MPIDSLPLKILAMSPDLMELLAQTATSKFSINRCSQETHDKKPSMRPLPFNNPGNQKTEFLNPRLNSRPLLPFNQPGFDRIGGAVKNNGSHPQVL